MHIVTLKREHIGACAWLADEAYASYFNSWLRTLPTSFPDHIKHFIARRLKNMLHSRNQIVRVALADDSDDDNNNDDTDGDVLGWAAWSRVVGAAEQADEARTAALAAHGWTQRQTAFDRFERWALGWTNWYHGAVNTDKGTDPAAVERMTRSFVFASTRVNEIMREHSPTGGFIYLQDLAVAPACQGRGVGRRLLAQGVAIAETERVPIALIATPSGNPLYVKAGFKVVGTDMLRTGFPIAIMIYWPEGMEPANLPKFVIRESGIFLEE